jgi:hypothetical protein
VEHGQTKWDKMMVDYQKNIDIIRIWQTCMPQKRYLKGRLVQEAGVGYHPFLGVRTKPK